ncbi:MAG: beta-propeller domain-containing protein, partial [FCB group bacterium]|nr:beta-propeller domain-containing protein [FCB group bacterium]
MRTSWKLSIPVLLLLLCSACPRPNPENRFTSADVRGTSRNTDVGLPGGLFGDALTDAEGGAGGSAARVVVEPDVVRRDGNILYILNQYRGLTLVDLDTRNILAQVPTYGFPRDLFVRGDRAYVLVGQAGSYVVLDNVASFDVNARLYVVDVSTPGEAEVVSQFDLEGDLVDSRLVGDVLYAVGGEYQWNVAEGGTVSSVQKQATGVSWVTSIDISDIGNIHEADKLSFNGQGTVIQATPDAIFVAAPDWSSGNSAITYVDISDPAGDMSVRDSVAVQGQIADRYKLDAYNGVLRVVSSVWNPERRVNLTTIDLANPDDLKVLAERDFETAHGDSLFATRFDGPRGYVVTFFQVDPLYVLDLSDPLDPKITGELEVPGWSTHIEPMGDRLLALGVDNTDGRKVSVSLFNVADPAAPSLVERVSFGDQWSWSSAYNDVKAFAVFDGVAVVPFSGWSDGTGGYDRLQFLSFTKDDLTVRGYVDVYGEVLRTLPYEALYYGVTQEELAAIDASDLDAPQVVERVTLAENAGDYVEISPALGVEVAARKDGATVVHTVNAAGVAQGTDSAALGQIFITFA